MVMTLSARIRCYATHPIWEPARFFVRLGDLAHAPAGSERAAEGALGARES
jgi:hypothetical protein